MTGPGFMRSRKTTPIHIAPLAFHGLFYLLVLCLSSGCGRPQPTRFIPPRTPLPDTAYTLTRDIATTWNALLRVLEDHQAAKIASKDAGKRKVVLAREAVDLLTYCDCGRMGKALLSGKAYREGVITLKRTAPQETMVRVRMDYWTKYRWKNARGEVVRTETIPCVSNGRFENRLYRRVRSYLAP